MQNEMIPVLARSVHSTLCPGTGYYQRVTLLVHDMPAATSDRAADARLVSTWTDSQLTGGKAPIVDEIISLNDCQAANA
jgi:hypothetical protein